MTATPDSAKPNPLMSVSRVCFQGTNGDAVLIIAPVMQNDHCVSCIAEIVEHDNNGAIKSKVYLSPLKMQALSEHLERLLALAT